MHPEYETTRHTVPEILQRHSSATALDTGLRRDTPGFVARKRPAKTFVQRNRLQIRSILLAFMAGFILFTDRGLYGTPLGTALYALGCLGIMTGALGRFWCYVYNSGARSKTVITTGPYAVCRNPIYGCSIVVAASVGLISESIVLAILFAGGASLFYLKIIAGEEKKLAWLHGDVYMAYRASTSKFIPRFARPLPGIVEKVPGEVLMRKIPKLILMGLIIPAVEIFNTLHDVLGRGLVHIF